MHGKLKACWFAAVRNLIHCFAQRQPVVHIEQHGHRLLEDFILAVAEQGTESRIALLDCTVAVQ